MAKIQQYCSKGFTLIELMIVVAIIGILAAIAIPQFASYRIKAFNSAALSDMRNIMTSEEANYATSQSYAASTSGIGATIITGLINTKASRNVTYNIQSLNSGAAYAVFTAHNRGDNIYAADYTGSLQFQHDANAPASPLDVRTFAIAGLPPLWGMPL